MLEKEVLPWLQKTYGDQTFNSLKTVRRRTQRLTPRHGCRENMSAFWPKDCWPPTSTDLNPMDFSVWSILESQVCRFPHSSLVDLRRDILTAWRGISEEIVRRTCAEVPSRLRRVIAAKGEHI